MARGFLAGAIWGIVASGIGAGTLSVMVGLPPEVQAGAQGTNSAPLRQIPDVSAQNVPSAPQVTQVPVVEPVQPTPPAPDPTPAPVLSGAAPDAPDGSVPAPQTAPVLSEQTVPEVTMPANVLPSNPAQDQVVVVDTTPAPTPAPAAPAAPVTDQAQEAAPARIALAEPEDNTRPSIGKPAGSLLDKTPAVPQGRLPKIGQTTQPTADGGEALPDTPLYKFAAPMPSGISPDMAKMSVILLDDGQGPLGPDMLNQAPFPISIAIGADHPNAGKAVADYRARGFEVLALTDIPSGARPSDIEVTLEATMEAVPEAIGVLEAPGSGLQDSRESAAQVTSFLSKTGHGMVVQTKGLNTAQKLAIKEGVPAVSVFRDLDAEGGNVEAISQGLSNASFRARQEGAVVTMARLNGTTWSALFMWGLQDRPDTLALVPVSHLMQASVTP